MLEKAGVELEEYETALQFSPSGYSVIMARDIDELWVNSYNPELTKAWDGNTDFQVRKKFQKIDFPQIYVFFAQEYPKLGVLALFVPKSFKIGG